MKATLCFLTLIVAVLANGQSVSKFIGLEAQTGFIIPHSSELRDISSSNPVGLSIEYSRLKVSEKDWQKCNCFARSGLGISYVNFGNSNELGSALSGYYFIQPYFDYKGKLTFSLKGAIGVSYLTKTYDEQTNPRNLFFSSPVSFLLVLAPEFGYIVNERSEFSITLNYNHISNGGSKQPNKGMNFPTISVGFSSIIDYTEPSKKNFDLIEFDKSLVPYVGGFGSIRSADNTDSTTNHLMLGLNGGLMKPLSKINGLNFGFEFSYDGSIKVKQENRMLDSRPIIFSIVAGHQFTAGKVLFIQQFGAYIFKPEIEDRQFFQRYSLYYSFFKNLSIGSSMIAHGHIADHLDVRVLYKM